MHFIIQFLMAVSALFFISMAIDARVLMYHTPDKHRHYPRAKYRAITSAIYWICASFAGLNIWALVVS